ncbi:hypothetical protein GOP47_0003105 [Adiantum capillus-veneris]|uniref:DNA mismatch repair proteins mutS family domain-containing protein n=1 Tax=Adiantum capillus-veneris TaxID=13818 RepID=A0A9D4ZRY2_ADICA|nr:hypothetical protein GOP47_0003105 [Adiantum capillus-veneris]
MRNQNFELPSARGESECLLSMTAAAIDLLSLLGSSLDFGGIQSKLMDSCLLRLQKGFVINGQEAAAIAMLLQFTETIQHDLKTSMEQNVRSENVLRVFLDTICTMGVQQEVAKAISKTVDEDGNVKDGASPELQRARVQYRMLETKVQELVKGMLREQEVGASTQEVDGRYCIAVSNEYQRTFPGLLLKSGGSTSYIEPVVLVSLNDKLGEARAAVSKAEYEALRVLTKKLLSLVESLTSLLEAVIQLDVVVARAKFSLMYEGSMPAFTGAQVETKSPKPGQGLSLQLRHAYHPLLLHQYKEHLHLQRARIRTRQKEASMELLPPVSIDISVAWNTRVVTITGPNTGGKTAAMKTLGLTALMAKSGLYVLAKEPAFLPWFDAVFADIGDEQSLFQSLSTFSGHLRRINDIKKLSTKDSLVLLDEVGTGTNPNEGAALGMSILESFASDKEGGAFLTIASTHHAELKTLKYSDNRFENASVEFDEESLKPTYRLLWGVPGRSCALNISERLGISKSILQAAERHLGLANAEINQVIMDLEKSKRDFENGIIEAEKYLKNAKVLHGNIKEAAEVVQEEEQNAAVQASNLIQEEAHKARASISSIHQRKLSILEKSPATMPSHAETSPVKGLILNLEGKEFIGRVGSTVFVPRLGKEAKVVQVLSGKRMVVVQSGSIQLRVSFSDVKL